MFIGWGRKILTIKYNSDTRMHGTACAIPASYDAAIFTSLVDGAPKGILAPGPMAQF